MTPKDALGKAAQFALLAWLLLGAGAYYYRFTTRFINEHQDALNALWARLF